jgi:hypothetical protein
MYRMSLTASITCTALLVLAGALSTLALLELAIGGYAAIFLLLLGGGYLLPLGAIVFGGLAAFLGEQWRDRRIAAIAILVPIGATAILYGLATHFIRE